MYRIKQLKTWEGGFFYGLLEHKEKTFSKEEVEKALLAFLLYSFEYAEEKEPVSVHISVSKKKISVEVQHERQLTSVYKEKVADIVVWEEI